MFGFAGTIPSVQVAMSLRFKGCGWVVTSLSKSAWVAGREAKLMDTRVVKEAQDKPSATEVRVSGIRFLDGGARGISSRCAMPVETHFDQ